MAACGLLCASSHVALFTDVDAVQCIFAGPGNGNAQTGRARVLWMQLLEDERMLQEIEKMPTKEAPKPQPPPKEGHSAEASTPAMPPGYGELSYTCLLPWVPWLWSNKTPVIEGTPDIWPDGPSQACFHGGNCPASSWS